MSVSVRSITEAGAGGLIVDVECHISNGLPNIIIVGMANKAIDEAKERLRSAFASASLELPRKRITINLAPADLPKDGSSFDLAMAAAILIAGGQASADGIHGTVMIGELGLDGSVRPVRGIIGKLLAARKAGMRTFLVPSDNLKQAMLVPDLELVPIRQLRDLYLELTNTLQLKRFTSGTYEVPSHSSRPSSNFKDIVGQTRAKRALEIAAAGAHNVLMSGPPGTGKSMLAKAMPSVLPPLQHEETLELTHLHSLASRQYDQIISERPFRSPHHSASDISILGGGTVPRPGEISLSHQGILFFDELPEYSRATLEALRQPLEDKTITIARSRDSITFPANFMLIATCNPCPCGYYGTSKPCSCMPHEIVKYQRKLSGPILDRIDLYVDVDEVKHENLLGTSIEESSQTIRNRVMKARARQFERYKSSTKTNANITNHDIKKSALLSAPAIQLLNQAAERLGISARSYMRIIKVARTIADLSDADRVDVAHISEALQYRRQTASL